MQNGRNGGELKEAPKSYCMSKELFNQNSLNIYCSNGRFKFEIY